MKNRAVMPKVGLGAVLLGAALALSLAPAAAKPLVVTASTAATVTIGQIIDGEATLTLPDSTKVTLIGPDGKTVALQGPYSGKPGQGGGSGDPTLVNKLAKLIETRQADANAIGAVRGAASSNAMPSQPWVVDIDASGTVCVLPGTAPVLWRADGATAMRMMLRRASANGSAAVDWSAGSTTMPWPADLPVVGGEKYFIRRPNRSLPNVVQLSEVPANLPTDAHRAVWMDENGCSEQALRLLIATNP
jgi:hypothetical protein